MKIRAEGLVKVYGKRKVVKGVSIEVKKGEIVGLLGPNGAGKTTTFYMVVGFVKPNDGNVYLDDENITSLPMYQRAQRGIGYLPQEPSVFRKLSVEDNIIQRSSNNATSTGSSNNIKSLGSTRTPLNKVTDYIG